MPVAISAPLEIKQGEESEEGKESNSDSDSDSDSEDEDKEDESGKLSARILLHVTDGVVTEETLQSNYEVKTGSTPLKDPVFALNPLPVETLNSLMAKKKSTPVNDPVP